MNVDKTSKTDRSNKTGGAYEDHKIQPNSS